MKSGIFASHLYLLSLCLLAFSLSWSNFLMSISLFMLAAAWLADGRYNEKVRKFFHNRSALVFSGIYILHLAGMIYAGDADRGFNDLRVKLPLLALPFFIAGMKPLSRRDFRIVLATFIAGVFTTMVISGMMQYGMMEPPPDFRGSAFISHIRFSLMICFAVFILWSCMVNTRSRSVQWLCALAALACVGFLFALKAMTGIAVFVLCVPIALFWLVLKTGNSLHKAVYGLSALLLLALPAAYLYSSIKDFYEIKDAEMPADSISAGGERYVHDLQDEQMENGHYTWRYIARVELEQSWNARSGMPFNGLDKQGQPLYATLIRYLTSKGLRKDAQGVAALSERDIEAVENSISNIRLLDGLSLDDRVYEIIWELHNYRHGVNPQGHSVSQRLEFWKTGWAIFRENPIIGVGTGGAKAAFAAQYEKMQSPLAPEFRLRGHNQYLTIMVTHGIIGLGCFLAALLYPFLAERKWQDFLYLMFIAIALLSMFNEDTLETQAGVTFVAFFNSLLLLACGKEGLTKGEPSKPQEIIP